MNRPTGPREHQPKHAARTPFALLVVGLVVGGMSLLLALNTASAANELRRHELAAKDAELAAELQQLKNQVAASAAPGALASAAAALGMVPAGSPAFLKINPDGTVRLLGSPAPASAVLVPAPPARPKPTTPAATRSATTTATPTRPATATATPTRSATAPATSTPGRTGTSRSAPRPSATPAADPTPTSTLPGGPR